MTQSSLSIDARKQKILSGVFGVSFFDISIFVTALVLFLMLILIKKNTITAFMVHPLIYMYAIFVSIFRISRIVSASFSKYSFAKIMPANSRDYEPTVSFIIPCKNEEKSIEKTVSKCFEALYPREKVEVIVINDGSTDGTMNVLTGLMSRFGRLTVVNWEKNRGKREGMTEGIRLATGEIVIQLDSDSYIPRITKCS